MEFENVIKARRSIRRYKEKQVPDKAVRYLLDLARHAPSSMNGQPWEFVVIKNRTTKQKLAELKNKYCPEEKREYRADFLIETPIVIVVGVDKAKSCNREIENGVLASAYILLSATNLGLGGVYLSAYRLDKPKMSREIRRILNIPKNIDPISILPLGYPGEYPQPKTLRRLEEMIHYEKSR